MTDFLISFLLMLLSGSIFILGFFTITRGKELLMPDGTKTIEKEVLGSWQLFWEHVKGYKRVYYYDSQLEFKLKILEQLKPEHKENIKLAREGKSLMYNRHLHPHEIRDLEFSLNTNVLYNDVAIFLYDEFPIYRFPEWVRKITNCYVCLSSIGGTFFYWFINYSYPYLFNWSLHQTICKICFWVVYCVSLAFLNKIIKENFDKEKK